VNPQDSLWRTFSFHCILLDTFIKKSLGSCCNLLIILYRFKFFFKCQSVRRLTCVAFGILGLQESHAFGIWRRRRKKRWRWRVLCFFPFTTALSSPSRLSAVVLFYTTCKWIYFAMPQRNFNGSPSRFFPTPSYFSIFLLCRRTCLVLMNGENGPKTLAPA